MAVIAGTIVLTLALAPFASANIGGLYPTYDDGGEAVDTLTTVDNLWVYTLSDVQGGDVCVVRADLVNPGNGRLNCGHPAWGSSNHIGATVGSSWHLIETPKLRAGTWKLLADGTSDTSVDVFSNEFTVTPCEPGQCDARVAEATAVAYKAAAADMALRMAGMKGLAWLLTKINPTEPFGQFKNMINGIVDRAVSALPIYLRVIAEKATKKLKFADNVPDGAHAMGLALLGDVTESALEMYLDIVHDPPADYATVAQPTFDVPELSSTDPDIDGMVLDIAQLTGYGAAGLTAYERYQKAAAEDNQAGVHRQAAAMARFDYKLVDEMYSAADGLDAYGDAMHADPEYAGAHIVQEHVDDLRPFVERMKTDGFTADELQALHDDGLVDAQIAQVANNIKTLDLDAVPLDVPIEDELHAAAATLREQAPAFDSMARDADAVAQSTNTLPVASFDASPAVGEPPLQVDFTDTSTDADAEDLTVTWDFGDGATAAGATVQHAFAEGAWTVTETVSDGTASSSATQTITAGTPYAPPALSVPAYPRSPVGVARTYQAGYQTYTHDASTLQTDFGDGTPVVTQEVTGSGNVDVDHTYASAGTYDVTFTVTDSHGGTATGSTPVKAANAVADAGANQAVDEGDVVHLGGDSTEPDANTSIEWTFGDGSPSASEVHPDHVYADNGVYTAKVTVTDGTGSKSSSAQITVANAPPIAAASVPGEGKPGVPISMRGFAHDPGTADTLSYHWSFGDGATADGRKTDHTYTGGGSRDVKLEVTDDDGAKTSVTRPVVVRAPLGERDTRGTDFWLAFPTNYSGTPTLTLFVSAETGTSGEVAIPALDFSTTFAVSAGEVAKVPLPPEAQLRNDAGAPEPLAVHVSSHDEVSVYGLNRIQYTTDAFVGLPSDALGVDYRVMSYSPTSFSDTGPEAAVVATRNGTTVTVTPTAPLTDNHPAGTPFDVHLDLGDVYQLRSHGDAIVGDPTGTHIRADKPVAVFGAHDCANVPITAGACDHLVEEMPPTDAWGESFVTMPLATRSGGDTFRILASHSATHVSVNGQAVATLAAGGFHEQLIDGPATIDADQPVLVAQYSNGTGFDNVVSDPFMVVVPPFEQFQAAYWVTTPSEGFSSNFINLVVPAAAADDLELDGAPVPAAEFKPIGSTDFVGAQVPVATGDHRIAASSPFGVIVYGYDQFDSYGYSGGYSLGRVAAVTALGLTPADETLDVGSRGCVDARASTAGNVAVPDVRVDLSISGANPATDFATTDARGIARFCFTGTDVGTDTVRASVGSVAATAHKTWRGANRPPAAADDTATAEHDTALAIPATALTANDSDPDADALTVASVTDATGGTVARSGTTITFTPARGFSGRASFLYGVTDGRGGHAQAAVRVTVRAAAAPAPHPVPTPPSPGADPPSGAGLVLACANRPIVLEDVALRGGRVVLVGVADHGLLGRTVELILNPSGKVVARATVRPDGTFAATAAAPPRRMRRSNRTRYEARVGDQRSLSLKLTRRMQVTRFSAGNGRVKIAGRVVLPLAKARKDRRIVVQRVLTCSTSQAVGTAMPRRNGAFSITVAAAAGQHEAVYRLTTKVARTARSPRSTSTFTLPRAVVF